jgi:hypothetical protein
MVVHGFHQRSVYRRNIAAQIRNITGDAKNYVFLKTMVKMND